jgi:hypothetical protein
MLGCCDEVIAYTESGDPLRVEMDQIPAAATRVHQISEPLLIAAKKTTEQRRRAYRLSKYFTGRSYHPTETEANYDRQQETTHLDRSGGHTTCARNAASGPHRGEYN